MVGERKTTKELAAMLEEATDNLIEQTDRLVEARRLEREASNRATDAQNSTNTAQKRVDELFKALRESAPVQTDWGQDMVARRKSQG